MIKPLTTYIHARKSIGRVTEAAVFIPVIVGRVDFRGAVPLVVTHKSEVRS